MDFRLAHPQALWLLVLLPTLALLVAVEGWRRRTLLAKVAEGPLLHRLLPQMATWRRAAHAVLTIAAVGLICLGLARPQFGWYERRDTAKGIDLYLLVDCSRSMLASNSDPGQPIVSRLDRARTIMQYLVRRLTGDRVGIIPFTSEAFVLCPLTLDHGIALDFIGELSPDLMGMQGTDLGRAIELALDSFDKVPSEAGRALVLVTDGEDHGLNAKDMARRAATAGVRIHAIGLGGEEATTVPDGAGGMLKGSDGKLVASRLDMQTLRDITAATGGRAWHSTGAGLLEVEAIFTELSGLARAEREERAFRVGDEKFPLLLAMALALLFIDWLLPSLPDRRTPWKGRFA